MKDGEQRPMEIEERGGEKDILVSPPPTLHLSHRHQRRRRPLSLQIFSSLPSRSLQICSRVLHLHLLALEKPFGVVVQTQQLEKIG
ncbi:hypothetical protein K1719_039521 [Acacia pycnantha]|nr:hypothetical protein K1719_039521 [Acacia pycnantha]